MCIIERLRGVVGNVAGDNMGLDQSREKLHRLGDHVQSSEGKSPVWSSEHW